MILGWRKNVNDMGRRNNDCMWLLKEVVEGDLLSRRRNNRRRRMGRAIAS